MSATSLAAVPSFALPAQGGTAPQTTKPRPKASHVGAIFPMDVIGQAAARGFELEERVLGDRWVWGWRRGDDDRHPCFLTEREAVDYMADRLRRIAVFE